MFSNHITLGKNSRIKSKIKYNGLESIHQEFEPNYIYGFWNGYLLQGHFHEDHKYKLENSAYEEIKKNLKNKKSIDEQRKVYTELMDKIFLKIKTMNTNNEPDFSNYCKRSFVILFILKKLNVFDDDDDKNGLLEPFKIYTLLKKSVIEAIESTKLKEDIKMFEKMKEDIDNQLRKIEIRNVINNTINTVIKNLKSKKK
jgi:hypothetical protein